ncbi:MULTISPECIES: hypothetical protein [Calothrix]|uniref:Uncharacterized protein n=2 Tax=Calothrix TaxID=1186 RepID=A0ABR8ADP1_9CYAN|nr:MULTISPECIES: hypothetical protein [Calothrix]MBD2197869.1 hypothetical protein [Calothrix parietina FACHB-288]MBD2226273.1 hypothetical protein [Calothrix anomala FACHB-343]
MDIQLIKRIEKPILPKPEVQEELSQPASSDDTFEIPESTIQQQPVLDVNYQESTYIPLRDRPLIQSVGNSGWQVSEIWRDLRIDNFYD